MSKNKLIWRISRTLAFIVIGLLNKVLIRPEDIGTLKNYVGYAFLLLATIDIGLLSFKLKKYKNE